MKKTALFLTAFAVCLGMAGCGPETTEPLDTIVQNTQPTRAIKPVNQVVEATAEPDADGVRLLGVAIGAADAYIEVRFSGPPELFTNWWQGSIYVMDEQTGYIFSSIPYVPVVGLLFGKPAHDNQPGYVMLNNDYGLAKIGTKLTVVLGNYKRLHVEVKAG